MAFNLNKTDQSRHKFNLSKDTAPPAEEKNEKKSGKSAWIILTLLVVGGFASYLLRGKPAAEDTATTAISTIKPVNSKVTATPADTLQNSIPGSFDPGSSSLHLEATVVNGLMDMLSKNPQKKLLIKGYASSEGDLAINRQLSGSRAMSFKEYLVDKGVAADRITTEARGIEDPIASNDTEAGRRKNRRVQVVIIN